MMLIPEVWFLPLICLLGPVLLGIVALVGCLIVRIHERRAIRRRLQEAMKDRKRT